MRIYDTEGNERDPAWLKETFGPAVTVDRRPLLAADGYELVELRSRSGPCALVALVLDENGRPVPGVDVARWWNDPGLKPLPTSLNYWRGAGVCGPTNGDGRIGFGMGKGDAYVPDGPAGQLAASEIWCEGNSDRISGLGWVWGTEHLHLEPTFRLVPGDENDEPTNPWPAIRDELKALTEHLVKIVELLA